MQKVSFNSLMVPTDFSDNAWIAFQHALGLVDGDESEIIVVHAIDPAIINSIVQLGFGDHDTILGLMKADALERMKVYAPASGKSINVKACLPRQLQDLFSDRVEL